MNTFRIANMTNPYTNYDMIQKHTRLPELAEYRMRLLLAFLNSTNEDQKLNETITIAASLVQLGLDTHDLVPVSNLQKAEADARSRQMKVLAGDYFSSRFYHILAQAGQIEMIKLLSAAICEVNRLKMSLYLRMKQMKMSAFEFLEQSVNIKLQLFLSFEHLIGEERSLIWSTLLSLFVKGEVLELEHNRSENPADFIHSYSYWHLFDSASKDEKKQLQSGDSDKHQQMLIQYNCKDSLRTMIEENRNQLMLTIGSIDSVGLKQEVNLIYEAFYNYQTV